MRTKARLAAIAWALCTGLGAAGPLPAETIAVIGTGNVGMALGTEFADQGHTIVYGSRNPEGLKASDLVTKTGRGASAALPRDAAEQASIIVLAVPGLVVGEVVEGLGKLDGKIIIDVTNPLTRSATLEFELDTESSNAEIIQSLAPRARVVKAFNTIPWPQMIDPGRAGGPVSVPLAGDDAEAKRIVAGLVEGMGLEPIDIGELRYARWTELGAVILLNNQLSNRPNFDLHLRKSQERRP